LTRHTSVQRRSAYHPTNILKRPPMLLIISRRAPFRVRLIFSQLATLLC